jgi:hypothetical protein
MLVRFYEIKVENENFEETTVNQEFTLEVPEHDMSTPLERQEHIGVLFDTIISASGLSVCSFSTQTI